MQQYHHRLPLGDGSELDETTLIHLDARRLRRARKTSRHVWAKKIWGEEYKAKLPWLAKVETITKTEFVRYENGIKYMQRLGIPPQEGILWWKERGGDTRPNDEGLFCSLSRANLHAIMPAIMMMMAKMGEGEEVDYESEVFHRRRQEALVAINFRTFFLAATNAAINKQIPVQKHLIKATLEMTVGGLMAKWALLMKPESIPVDIAAYSKFLEAAAFLIQTTGEPPWKMQRADEVIKGAKELILSTATDFKIPEESEEFVSREFDVTLFFLMLYKSRSDFLVTEDFAIQITYGALLARVLDIDVFGNADLESLFKIKQKAKDLFALIEKEGFDFFRA